MHIEIDGDQNVENIKIYTGREKKEEKEKTPAKIEAHAVDNNLAAPMRYTHSEAGGDCAPPPTPPDHFSFETSIFIFIFRPGTGADDVRPEKNNTV